MPIRGYVLSLRTRKFSPGPFRNSWVGCLSMVRAFLSLLLDSKVTRSIGFLNVFI